MLAKHRIVLDDAHQMSEIADQSIDLVVTSPPYPMVEMWDAAFGAADPTIADALNASDEERAFELMHVYLDGVWQEVRRVLKPGGIACINIGDATRSGNGGFRVFPNHARTIMTCLRLGLSLLPTIIWRKTTNAPTKFMGSGMLPPGAYVTLEHEYILILRKGGKRAFTEAREKQNRRASAYFWEERNLWFSDVWFDLRGTPQVLSNSGPRERSAAFPLELAYRLINMFSVRGDTVLDPFLGTGTTLLAAMCSGRHCIGYEIDPAFQPIILKAVGTVPDLCAEIVGRRLAGHLEFVRQRSQAKNDFKHINRHYGVPVMTGQEEDLVLEGVREVRYLTNQDFNTLTAPWPHGPASSPDVLQAGTPAGACPPKTRQLRLF